MTTTILSIENLKAVFAAVAANSSSCRSSLRHSYANPIALFMWQNLNDIILSDMKINLAFIALLNEIFANSEIK